MSELLGLAWADLDLEGGWIKVRQQLTEEDLMADGEDPSDLKTAAGTRDVDTVRVLAAHRERQWRELREAGVGYDDRGLVLPGASS
jgi:integrase